MSAMNPTELRAECARLAELAAKATPGPWRAGRELPCAEGAAPYRFVYRSDDETPYSRLKITGGDDDHNDLFDCDADAELIASAPAAYAVAAQVPALLDRIAELERDAGRYRALRAAFQTEELAQRWERVVDETLVKDAAMQERTDKLSSTQTKEGGE